MWKIFLIEKTWKCGPESHFPRFDSFSFLATFHAKHWMEKSHSPEQAGEKQLCLLKEAIHDSKERTRMCLPLHCSKTDSGFADVARFGPWGPRVRKVPALGSLFSPLYSPHAKQGKTLIFLGVWANARTSRMHLPRKGPKARGQKPAL